MSATTAMRGDQFARGYETAMEEVRRREAPFRSRQRAPAPPPPAKPGEHERFAQLLGRFRVRLQVSRKFLADEAGCNPSYLTRIEHGDREPPRRHIVDALARALCLNDYEYRRFVTAAGYAPVREWTPALEQVCAPKVLR